MTKADEQKFMLLKKSKNKMKRIIFSIAVLLLVLWQSDTRMVSADNQNRVRFQVTTISESAKERKVLAQTTIEGLPGTDFNINLQTKNFKMQARFLTDLISSEKMKIRANLDTRRFFGLSPLNLPLYEEDSQKQNLEIGFDETIVLLPFGRNGGEETLKIEITPTRLLVSKEEAEKPLKINFDQQIPGGEIYIGATKIPHHYEVEARLLANGEEIAGGKSDCLYEEEKEIILQPKRNSDSQTFAAKVTVNEFSRSRPNDLVGISYNFYQKKPLNENLPIIDKGLGINMLGGEFSYRLESENLPKDKNYELRFRIKLSADEK
jgi:hypothetical protein